jgi:membrane protease YdiL (CAAX protease family)
LNRQKSQKSKTVSVGFLGSIAIVSAVLVFMFAQTFGVELSAFYSAVLFLIVGVVFSWVTVGVQWSFLDLKHIFTDLFYVALSVGAVFIVNSQVPFKLQAQNPVGVKMFSVLMGVAEECFFRLWLCNFFYLVSKSMVLSIVVSSGIWTIYHIARYQGQPSAFFVIFGAGCILGFVMLTSRRADAPIFAHGVVNYIAS